jgi:hypothetical protein
MVDANGVRDSLPMKIQARCGGNAKAESEPCVLLTPSRGTSHRESDCAFLDVFVDHGVRTWCVKFTQNQIRGGNAFHFEFHVEQDLGIWNDLGVVVNWLLGACKMLGACKLDLGKHLGELLGACKLHL